ncbi:type II toxin-antitoxin system RelE/ParE family toxin [Erythrobacter oryzae]|uniref:type II toxin-antitoxin system RelE/ParE family toxin n=1 Tax=Erythrobacter oryzae TaxID=3019556 RepID=UPI002555213E|nr:type II toxin-antitoxin system RelE/ParE family toxin [Erythrobacter sp. COR-2]
MRLVVRPSVRRDLALIWTDTANRWGIDQADAYVAAINARFGGIADFPSSYPEYRSKRAAFRKAASGEHLIFYVVTADRVEVVRVLHNRMDVDEMLG